jgi:hypothetical protein
MWLVNGHTIGIDVGRFPVARECTRCSVWPSPT